eukprot:14701-Heterococcus_DN1.PRE.2
MKVETLVLKVCESLRTAKTKEARKNAIADTRKLIAKESTRDQLRADPTLNCFKRLIKNAAQLAKVEVDSVAKKQTLPDKAIAHLVWDLVRWADEKSRVLQTVIIFLLEHVKNILSLSENVRKSLAGPYMDIMNWIFSSPEYCELLNDRSFWSLVRFITMQLTQLQSKSQATDCDRYARALQLLISNYGNDIHESSFIAYAVRPYELKCAYSTDMLAQEMVDSFSALSRRTDINQSSQGGVLQCIWQLLDGKAKQHLLLCADSMYMIRRTQVTEAATSTTATNGVIGTSSSQYGSSSAMQSSSSSSKRPTKRARIEHPWDNLTMIINANLSAAATTSGTTGGSSSKDTSSSGCSSASITATAVSTNARLLPWLKILAALLELYPNDAGQASYSFLHVPSSSNTPNALSTAAADDDVVAEELRLLICSLEALLNTSNDVDIQFWTIACLLRATASKHSKHSSFELLMKYDMYFHYALYIQDALWSLSVFRASTRIASQQPFDLITTFLRYAELREGIDSICAHLRLVTTTPTARTTGDTTSGSSAQRVSRDDNFSP